MQLIFLLGLALFSLAQASPIPSDALEGATILKSDTLPDGTLVQEIKEKDGSVITMRIFNLNQLNKIDEELAKLPVTQIIKNPPGYSDVLKVPANELYSFLLRNGFKFPLRPEDHPFYAPDPYKSTTIYLTQLYKVLANVDQLDDIPVPILVKVLKTRPTLQVVVPQSAEKIPVEVPQSAEKIPVEVPQSAEKRICKNGVFATVGKVATGAATGILGGVADLFGSGLFAGLANGAKKAINHAHKTATDVACGLEDIVDFGVGHVIHLVKETGKVIGDIVSAEEKAEQEAYDKAVKGLRAGIKELLDGIIDIL